MELTDYRAEIGRYELWAKKRTYKHLYVLPNSYVYLYGLPNLYVLLKLYVHLFVLPNSSFRMYVLPNLYVSCLCPHTYIRGGGTIPNFFWPGWF